MGKDTASQSLRRVRRRKLSHTGPYWLGAHRYVRVGDAQVPLCVGENECICARSTDDDAQAREVRILRQVKLVEPDDRHHVLFGQRLRGDELRSVLGAGLDRRARSLIKQRGAR